MKKNILKKKIYSTDKDIYKKSRIFIIIFINIQLLENFI